MTQKDSPEKFDANGTTSQDNLSKVSYQAETIYLIEIDGEFTTIKHTSNNTASSSNTQGVAPPKPEGKEARLQLPQEHRPQLRGLSRGLLIGSVAGIVLATAGIHLTNRPAQKLGAAGASNQSQAPAPNVTVAEVELTSIERTLQATGSVAALELIPVMSAATGLQIQQVLVEEGDNVAAGQVLASLDNSVLQAQLAEAKASVSQAEARLKELQAGSRKEEIARAQETVKSAQAAVKQAESDLDLARKRVQRNQSLEAEGAIARDRLDEVINEGRNQEAELQRAQAQLREAQQQLAELRSGARPEVIAQARSQLAQAKAKEQLVLAQLNDTRVIAPVSGKVAQRNARVGDITASEKLFTIIEEGHLELRLKVPETQLAQIRPGQKVKVTSDLDSRLQLTGTIRTIEPLVDQESRQATVEVDLLTSEMLKPGMFLRASIVTSTNTGLAIPTEAILPQLDGSTLVYALQSDNTVKAQSILTGEILANGQVEIIEGLASGDRVVVKGAAFLKDGDRVEATP